MSKLANKSKNPIKSNKQQLCDRINKCKSLKELKQWKKVFSYHEILKDDEEWDYEFLLDLIEFKLRRMRDYFWTHDIVVHEKQWGDICQRLINLLRAGYKTRIITQKDLGNIYVNTKNAYRYFNPNQLEFIMRESLNDYYLPTVRAEKAKKLFWKYFYYKIEYLWD